MTDSRSTSRLPRLPRLKVASRANIDPFIVMDVLAAANARAAAGADVIHMEVGEPGSGPPQPALTAVRQALGRIPLGYTEALGRPPLRAAIAEHHDHLYGLAVDPSQVAVTVGASAGPWSGMRVQTHSRRARGARWSDPRSARRQPVQSDRHHAGAGRARRARPVLPGARHPPDRRRDLPRHRL